MKGSNPLGLLLIILLCLGPNVVWAQEGMDFSEDEATADPEEETEVAEESDDGMDFDSTETNEEEQVYSDEGPQTVAVVALPGPSADDDRRKQIQAEMMRFAGTVNNVTPTDGSAVLAQLESRGMEECVVEPICLSEVGEATSVDRILIARVKDGDNGVELAIDYFDVEDRLFIKYHSEVGLGGTASIVAAVEPSLKDIFEVRDVVDGPQVVDQKGSGVVQTVLAYGTAGLAVVSLGLGIVFGVQASGAKKDLEGSAKNSAGIYTMTQQEANDELRAAKSKATTANIFYGLATGLAITSALLFYIKGGSDVATQEELSDRGFQDFKIAPAVSAEGVGVGAGFKF